MCGVTAEVEEVGGGILTHHSKRMDVMYGAFEVSFVYHVQTMLARS